MAVAPSLSARAETTRGLTSLPPKAADRTAKKDLLSVLAPVDHISSGMRVRLGEVDMLTAPYGTPLSGLCRYDDLILKYAPTASAPRGAEQPVRPYGIEAEAWFHAIRAPIAELAPPKAAAAVWDDDCDKLSTTPSAFWFRAPSAEDAARAVNLLFAATSALKAGRVRTTDCADFARWKMTCEQMVLDKGRIDQITHVSPCPA
ncbi:MAG TPA: hypothetical protein VGH15_07980, partial [Caulobacteraceae bacterium]